MAIIGLLILRRMRDKTRKHRFFYLTAGNVLLGVGVTILTIPIDKVDNGANGLFSLMRLYLEL